MRDDIRYTVHNWAQNINRHYQNYQENKCNKIDNEEKCKQKGCNWQWLNSAPKNSKPGYAWSACVYSPNNK